MFCVVVRLVVTTFLPVYVKLTLGFRAFNPVELHIQRFDAPCNNGVVNITCSWELSTWIGDLGWGHPISVSVFLSGTISCAVMKRPANSASAADVITDLITVAMERTVPLGLGMG